jgi:hypothetical protein
MSITVTSLTKEETAYDKYIQFTYEGESYSVLLHWDKWDGFDLTFTETTNTRNWIETPEWVTTWEDSQQYGAESFEYTLECLSEEKLEASYL